MEPGSLQARSINYVQTKYLTQAAAGVGGVVVGMLVWYVLAASPPAIAVLLDALVIVFGTLMAGIIDALSGVRGKRRHVAWYILGLLPGLLLMIFLIGQGYVPDPGGQPSPTPAPSASPSAAQ